MANEFIYSYECVISGTSATIDLLSQAPLPGGPVALSEDTPNDALLSLSELGYFEGADPTSTGFTYLGTFTTMGGTTIVFAEVNGETFAYVSAGLVDDDVSPGDDSLQILNFAQTDFVLCFCAGTMIETPGGPVPVERLRVDDLVVVEGKSPMPIRWIGRQLRVVDQQRNHAPVRISAGALGDGVPSKDLFLSADHAVLVDGILVTARSLVNDSTISWVDRPGSLVAYYHIELDTHELIVANDTLAETYLDEVPRSHFDNWMEWVELNRTTMTCEPLPFLRAKSRRQLPASIRARIDERATSLESKRTF